MKNNALFLPVLLIFLILALHGLLLAPLYQYLITDIVLQDTLWLDLVDLLFQHVETIGNVILLTFLIFAVYRYRLRRAKPLFFIGGGAILFKYFATILAISIEYGSLDLTGGLTPYLFAFLLELGIAALVVFLAHRAIPPVQDDYLARYNAAKTLQKPFAESDPCYPFKKVFSWKNPIQRTMMLSILVIVLWRLAAALVSEFTYGVMLKPGDVPVILFYWLILIFLPAFYSYFLGLLFFKLCIKKTKE
ncbi:MAG: hypothetical protein E7624_02960 [Ruminococcaceae bacterium]|nr:hypothetical protein [Oscillospiraceae bacterium]